MSDSPRQKMDIKEFRDKGYLLEVNRQFFHPLGLALAVRAPKTEGDPWTLDSIWDCRDDPEGIYFEPFSAEELVQGRAIEAELKARAPERMKRLGFIIQPLNEGPS